MNRKHTNTHFHANRKNYSAFTTLCSVLVTLSLSMCLFPLPARAELQSNESELQVVSETESTQTDEDTAEETAAFLNNVFSSQSVTPEYKSTTLATFVSVAQADIAQVCASDDGSDVEQGKMWVPVETWQNYALALAQGEELIRLQNTGLVNEEDVHNAWDALYTAWCTAQEEKQEAPDNALQNGSARSLNSAQENESDSEDVRATTSLSCTNEHGIVETDEGSYVADEMLVTFENNTSRGSAYTSLASIEETQNNALAKAVSRIDEADTTQAVNVELEEQSNVLEVVQEAREMSTVSVAQPNMVYYASEIFEGSTTNTADTNNASESTDTSTISTASTSSAASAATAQSKPNDPALASSSTSYYREQAWHLYSINAFDAWDIVQTNNTVTVAVLDTGCNLEHEDVTNQIWQDYAYNAWLEKKLTKDYAGHGTHVAGCVAAEANNGVGTAGASYNARILPICVFDTNGEYCYTKTLVSAYNYLEDYIDKLNIHVVNMSLGGYGSLSEDDKLLQECIAQAQDKNVVSVCAGGNGDNNRNPKTDPSYPSDYDDCIAVTALSTASDRTPTTWCDYNENKDICAPGQNIYSSCIYSSYSPGTDSYTWKDGTSMAAPIVSGSLALLWALDPTLTAKEAKQLIYSTADTLNLSSEQAGREGLYGHGILNIGAAVQKLHAQLTRQCKVSDQPYAANYDYVEYTGTVEEGCVVYVLGTPMLQKGSAWVALVPTSDAQALTDNDFTFETTTPQTVRTDYDVNNNNRTNIVDAQIIYDIACGIYTDFSVLSMRDMLAADVTGDEVIDAADAYALQTKLLSL